MRFDVNEKIINSKIFFMSIVKFKRYYPASDSFNNFMDDFLPKYPSLFRDNNGNGFGQLAPVNIKQSEEGYQLEIVAPGFKKEDFKISLENNLLTVSADTNIHEEDKKESYIREEYKWQPFKRSFTLNEEIDTDRIEAKCENGVLTLNLWNKKEVKAPVKQITVQ